MNTIIPITEMHLDSTINRPRTRLKEIRGVGVHYTANTNVGANAKANRNYFNNTTTYASTQYIVDDNFIIECMPYYEVAWALGAQSYTEFGNSLKVNGSSPNYSTINIEMCVNKDADYTKVVENTISLVAALLIETGLTPDKVFRHHDVTGKSCPLYYLDNEDWKRFLELVQISYDNMIDGKLFEIIDYSKSYDIRIKIDALNIRKGPNMTFEVTGIANTNDELVVITETDGWLMTDKGWVINETNYYDIIPSYDELPEIIFTEETYGEVIDIDSLPVRTEADTYSEQVAAYSKGTLVRIYKEKNNWYNTDKGWIYTQYVRVINYRIIGTIEVPTTVFDKNDKSKVIYIASPGENYVKFISKTDAEYIDIYVNGVKGVILNK